MNHPNLSKSKYTAGIQCHKRLYLEIHEPELKGETSSAVQAILDWGHRVGEVAHKRFPGGVLVEANYLQHDQSIQHTKKLIEDRGIPAIFEAGFTSEGIRVRADVLSRVRAQLFDLTEVKSTSKMKDYFLSDLAIQFYVLAGSGVEIRRAGIMHLNTGYIYRGGDYDYAALFTIEDLTKDVRAMQAEIPDQLKAMRKMLAAKEPPEIEVGPHCSKPYECPFMGHCWTKGSDFPVSELPNARQALRDRLAEEEIEDIRDIPEDFSGLSVLQRLVRDVVISGQPQFHPGLKQDLGRVEYPLHFLDFETFMPPLPLYKGTRPYETIPFQWSVHTLTRSGTLKHREYLHDGADDPRPILAEILLETLGEKGSIVTYSPYERRMIGELARALPQRKSALNALLPRLYDLLPVIRARCYHPQFHGSFSIKNVLPALVPSLSYDDLDIQDGSAASVGYMELLDAETPPARRRDLRAGLLAYCKTDTLAMVKLYETLKARG
ncbi:DUF2779 domain-containing protein [Candidatus Sumerlaeota bacterium]|nr:DUF2779 domain-containing protein [Candidatus Sumerlaeota bacterium]